MRSRPFLFFALLGFSTAASAVEVRVGSSVSINLPSEPGFCQMVASNSQDKVGLDNTQKMIAPNILLAYFADCKQLKAWHTTKGYYMHNFIQVQTQPNTSDTKQTNDDVKKACRVGYRRSSGTNFVLLSLRSLRRLHNDFDRIGQRKGLL
jgi:hypothetical protein